MISHLLEVSDTVLVGRLQEIIPVVEPSKKAQEVPKRVAKPKASLCLFSSLGTASQAEIPAWAGLGLAPVLPGDSLLGPCASCLTSLCFEFPPLRNGAVLRIK